MKRLFNVLYIIAIMLCSVINSFLIENVWFTPYSSSRDTTELVINSIAWFVYILASNAVIFFFVFTMFKLYSYIFHKKHHTQR